MPAARSQQHRNKKLGRNNDRGPNARGRGRGAKHKGIARPPQMKPKKKPKSKKKKTPAETKPKRDGAQALGRCRPSVLFHLY